MNFSEKQECRNILIESFYDDHQLRGSVKPRYITDMASRMNLSRALFLARDLSA